MLITSRLSSNQTSAMADKEGQGSFKPSPVKDTNGSLAQNTLRSNLMKIKDKASDPGPLESPGNPPAVLSTTLLSKFNLLTVSAV